jgi:hypothetical protein
VIAFHFLTLAAAMTLLTAGKLTIDVQSVNGHAGGIPINYHGQLLTM